MNPAPGRSPRSSPSWRRPRPRRPRPAEARWLEDELTPGTRPAHEHTPAVRAGARRAPGTSPLEGLGARGPHPAHLGRIPRRRAARSAQRTQEGHLELRAAEAPGENAAEVGEGEGTGPGRE